MKNPRDMKDTELREAYECAVIARESGGWCDSEGNQTGAYVEAKALEYELEERLARKSASEPSRALRLEIAAMAMQGLLANPNIDLRSCPWSSYAKDSLVIADALMSEELRTRAAAEASEGEVEGG